MDAERAWPQMSFLILFKAYGKYGDIRTIRRIRLKTMKSSWWHSYFNTAPHIILNETVICFTEFYLFQVDV